MFRVFVVLAILLLATPALGQRSGRPEGMRGPMTVDLSDGEPISFFLEISRELGLSDSQKGRLIDMRRKLRAQNAPFMKQLDSLRSLAGVELGETGGLTAEDRDALERFRVWSRPVIDSIRVNNDLARAEVRAMLDETQRATADSVATQGRQRQPARRRPGM
jgi:hypothetical protein